MRTYYLLGIVLLVTLVSCKKENDTPSSGASGTITVTTTAPSNQTATTATSGGTITNTGSDVVIARGICWKIGSMPTIADAKTVDGFGSGTFTSTLTNLEPYTIYTVRAYATTNAGTIYGNEKWVNTPHQLSKPTLTLNELTSSSSTYAHVDANFIDTGYAAISEKGFCWSTSPNPTIADSVLSEGPGYEFGYFSSYTTALSVNTTYYFRAFATNSVGTGYSNELSITTVYHIGEGHGGGKIFYVDGSGWHGLIASLTDQSNGARWNNTTNPFSWINAYSWDNGFSNTTNIITAIGMSGSAAAIARSYNGGGYTDWYLPSLNELSQLALQQNLIGNFMATYYWSSTASSTDNSTAYVIDFGANTYTDRFKSEMFLVRAIRAF